MASRAAVATDGGEPVTQLYDGLAPDSESVFTEPHQP
jgi:hypothetical protein